MITTPSYLKTIGNTPLSWLAKNLEKLAGHLGINHLSTTNDTSAQNPQQMVDRLNLIQESAIIKIFNESSVPFEILRHAKVRRDPDITFEEAVMGAIKNMSDTELAGIIALHGQYHNNEDLRRIAHTLRSAATNPQHPQAAVVNAALQQLDEVRLINRSKEDDKIISDKGSRVIRTERTQKIIKTITDGPNGALILAPDDITVVMATNEDLQKTLEERTMGERKSPADITFVALQDSRQRTEITREAAGFCKYDEDTEPGQEVLCPAHFVHIDGEDDERALAAVIHAARSQEERATQIMQKTAHRQSTARVAKNLKPQDNEPRSR